MVTNGEHSLNNLVIGTLGIGSLKKGPQYIGKSREGGITKIHMVAANAETPLKFRLSAGHRGDAPCGREVLSALGEPSSPCFLLMDRAYEGNKTQQLSRTLGYEPVVPPNPNRLKPWNYDKELYKRRNEVERLFRLIFTRYDKLDCLFREFLVFAFIVDALYLY